MISAIMCMSYSRRWIIAIRWGLCIEMSSHIMYDESHECHEQDEFIVLCVIIGHWHDTSVSRESIEIMCSDEAYNHYCCYYHSHQY